MSSIEIKCNKVALALVRGRALVMSRGCDAKSPTVNVTFVTGRHLRHTGADRTSRHTASHRVTCNFHAVASTDEAASSRLGGSWGAGSGREGIGSGLARGRHSAVIRAVIRVVIWAVIQGC